MGHFLCLFQKGLVCNYFVYKFLLLFFKPVFFKGIFNGAGQPVQPVLQNIIVSAQFYNSNSKFL